MQVQSRVGVNTPWIVSSMSSREHASCDPAWSLFVTEERADARDDPLLYETFNILIIHSYYFVEFYSTVQFTAL